MSRSQDRREAAQREVALRAAIANISRVEVAIDALNSAARADHQGVIDADVRRAIITERDRLNVSLGTLHARAVALLEADHD